MWRYSYDSYQALSFVDSADLVMIAEGVPGYLLIGAHEGYDGVMAAIKAWAAAAPGLRITEEIHYGVSMDGSNAEAGARLMV
jgi:hypothetical protein